MMVMVGKRGDVIYFLWSIAALLGAAALVLYAFVAFVMGGDDRRIQLAFTLSVLKLITLIIGSIKALSGRKRYLISNLIASSILPSLFLGLLIRKGLQPFIHVWSFDDLFILALMLIDLAGIFLNCSRLLQLRAIEVTPCPQ